MKASVEFANNKTDLIWRESQFNGMMESCESLFESVCLPMRPLSQEEADYPLAFVFLVHKDREAVLSLFQSLYFPQNLYCLTYDLKAGDDIKRLVHHLYKCLPNVIIPPEQIKVVWGYSSILKSTMNCHKELYERIFKIYNGAQDIDLIKGQMFRLDSKFKTPNAIKMLPGNLTYYKSSVAVGLSRDFIQFVFNTSLVQQFYEWLDGTLISDEGFWGTLAHNRILNAPGGYPAKCLHQKNATVKKSISRFQIWPNRKCAGRWVRGSCSLAIGDIPRLLQAVQLIAHKVDYVTDSLVHVCLKEWVQNRTYGLSAPMTNYSYYLNLPAVKYHAMKEKSKYTC